MVRLIPRTQSTEREGRFLLLMRLVVRSVISTILRIAIQRWNLIVYKKKTYEASTIFFWRYLNILLYDRLLCIFLIDCVQKYNHEILIFHNTTFWDNILQCTLDKITVSQVPNALLNWCSHHYYLNNRQPRCDGKVFGKITTKTCHLESKHYRVVEKGRNILSETNWKGR